MKDDEIASPLRTQPKPTRSQFQFSLGCLFVLMTAIACVCGGCMALWKWAEGQDVITTIDCGRGRRIDITAARAWEVSQPVYYVVLVDGEIVVPTTFILSGDPEANAELQFTLFAADQGNLVGVTLADKTDEYLIIHDFASGASWPSGDHVKWDFESSVEENNAKRDRSQKELEQRLNDARALLK